MKRHSVLLISVVALGCSSSSSPATVPDPGAQDSGHASHDSGQAAKDTGQAQDAGSLTPAEQAFWKAFHAGDLAAGTAAFDELQTDYKANPKDPYNTLLLGLCSLWELVEAPRDPATEAKTEATFGPVVGQYLGAAYALAPTNAIPTAFLGITTFDQGQRTMSQPTIMQGEMLVDQAYTENAQFGAFFKILESQGAPVDDPAMQSADDAAWTFLDICSGTTVNHTTPDLGAFAANENSGTGRPHCYKDDIAPHGEEGFLLNIGDLLVKEDKVGVAKQIYSGAKLSSTYDAWPYKSVLESRLSSDLDARAALYKGDPSTWPPYGVPNVQCGVCHQGT